MKIFTFPTEYFNVCDTLECGQVFRYKQLDDNKWCVWSLNHYAELTQGDDVVTVVCDDEEYFRNYFDLSTDYGKIVADICSWDDSHKHLKHATQMGKGIRILRQNPFETTISFIISANNNIKRIQGIVERLCVALGQKTDFGYAFPTAEKMASVDEAFYASIGAGYRASYLASTAKVFANNPNFFDDFTDSASDKPKLLSLLGVGPKVADCILLFGFHYFDVFPVDTWVKKIYHNYYENGLPDNKIAGYLVQTFGQYAGIIQQYLFYFERKYLQTDTNTLK